MRMEINRHRIRIVPENEMDVAYIEDTLGLKKEGDMISLKRISPIGLSFSLAYLEAKKEN